jgi:hypothetical protein
MFARFNPLHRLARPFVSLFADATFAGTFADTRSAGTDALLTLSPFARWDAVDAQEQLALSNHADHTLLLLVVCAAAATLVLALASSLGG